MTLDSARWRFLVGLAKFAEHGPGIFFKTLEWSLMLGVVLYAALKGKFWPAWAIYLLGSALQAIWLGGKIGTFMGDGPGNEHAFRSRGTISVALALMALLMAQAAMFLTMNGLVFYLGEHGG